MEERAVRVAKEREREKGLANAATKPGLYVGSRILRFRLQHVNPGSADPQPPPPVKKIIFHSKVTKTLTLAETLSIINKSKHPPQKGRIQRTKWKDSHAIRQKNHLRRRITKGTSSS